MIGTGIDRGRGHRRLVARVAAMTAGSLAAGMLAAVAPPDTAWASPPAASAGQAVPVHPVAAHPVKTPAMPLSHRTQVTWPVPGAATVDLSSGAVRAGSLPVWVGPAPATGSGANPAVGKRVVPGRLSSSANPLPRAARVTVSMASQSTSTALGVRGVVFTVATAAAPTTAGRVHVSLDYSSFKDAYGGGYASRLRLVELPACALTTPRAATCRTQVPLASTNNARTAQVAADVTVPGSGSKATAGTAAPKLVLAATTASQGSGGNYGAEPMSEEDQWVTGDSSGAYEYSYPIDVPPVPGDLKPTVALDYSSQSVDGLNASTNNEASSIGDGWNYEPGFVEADYQTCAAARAPKPDTLDLCGGSPELTLTMDGETTPLVVTSTGSIRPEADGAQQVIQTSAGGYEIVEPDGTQFWFGLNKLPGYATGDPTTNSLWTVPVWQSTGMTTATWRWMLDYVADANGNAMAYFYNTQTNYYAEGNGQTEGTVANGAYTQGGALAKIEYGLRSGSVYTQTPAAQVTFTTGTAVRQDAPTDLACAKNAACTVNAPTFWTSNALTGISTQALVGGTLQNVDSWTLSQAYPATNDPTTSPSLWLSSITHTGLDGTTPITLPPTSFSGTPMPNLAATAADKSAGYSLITRLRLTSTTSQTGASTTVAYSSPSSACAAGTFPKDYANTGFCYPDYWWTDPFALVDREDWYNLYDTASVTVADTTGGGPAKVTSYTYGGPSWHYDNDTISRSANWTWDQWRGFHSVTTETGTAPDAVTENVVTYFQGMSQDQSDYRFNGGVISNGQVTLASTRGDSVEDKDQYAGMKFEKIAYNGAGSGVQTEDTIWFPFTSTATGTNSTFFQASYVTGTTSTATYTALASGGSRKTTVTYTYNGYGQVLSENEVPDTADTSQNTCTSTTYTVNTSAWIVDLPSEVKVTAGASCAAAVSDTQYTYDGGTLTHGNVTQTRQLNATASGGTVTENYTYDQYGRQLTAQDGDGRTTTSAYSPATGASPTSDTITDPMGLATTTTYDPARGLATGTTDPAGYQSAQTYDALGRVTAQWTPGNPTSGPPVEKFSYLDGNTVPSMTTEQTEQPGGGYLTTQKLYDSLGRERETQTQTANGGTDISDVTYDSNGLEAMESGPYYVSGPPSGVLVAAANSAVPSQTGFVYDGDGRTIKTVSYALGVETYETDTAYGGNYTTTVPPTGGVSDTEFTDGRGLTTAIYQYHAGVPASPTDPPADFDKTTYTYTPAQKLAGITDAAGNAWAYTYDQLGDQITQSSPDSGTTTAGYDNAGQLISATDARSKQTSYTYDLDGRRTASYDTTGGAAESASTQLTSLTYDTLGKGLPTSSTSYSGGNAYTEQVTGYSSQGLPSGTAIVVPAAQGPLAGTYTRQFRYAPTGQLTSYTYSADGNLPAETVTTGYDAAGEPNALTGVSPYVSALSYTDIGQPLQYQLGTSSQPAYITDTYDPQTGSVTEQNTQIGTAKASINDLHYAYDQAGNVTSEADTPAGAPDATDVQCFQYDYLARLTQAWAQGQAGCAGAPSASVEGGPAPYWNAYSYNAIGDLTGITATAPSGATTTTTNTYPATGSAQPHAPASASITTASGTSSTAYTYDSAGRLATAAGPTQSQALTWNDTGQLTQDVVTPAGGSAQSSTYVYASDGSLLLTTDPTGTTLYLPDEELSVQAGSGAVSGTRYYSLNGVTVATRSGASAVAYVVGDTQGTDSTAIDASTLSVTRRYYDPYGNLRGTAPASFPTGQKGFVGGTTDPATGLTNLGAREYQPGQGVFISPDPLLKPYEPQNLNPYAYAQGNPTTYSDPTGTTRCDVGDCPTPWQTTHGANFCETHNCSKAGSPYNGPAYADPDNNPYSGGPNPYNPAKYKKREKYLKSHPKVAARIAKKTLEKRLAEERAARKAMDQQAAARKAAAAAKKAAAARKNSDSSAPRTCLASSSIHTGVPVYQACPRQNGSGDSRFWNFFKHINNGLNRASAALLRYEEMGGSVCVVLCVGYGLHDYTFSFTVGGIGFGGFTGFGGASASGSRDGPWSVACGGALGIGAQGEAAVRKGGGGVDVGGDVLFGEGGQCGFNLTVLSFHV